RCSGLGYTREPITRPLGLRHDHDGASRLNPVCFGSTKVVSGISSCKMGSNMLQGRPFRAGPVSMGRSIKLRSALAAIADHVGFIGVFRYLPPQVFVVTERLLRLPDLFVI